MNYLRQQFANQLQLVQRLRGDSDKDCVNITFAAARHCVHEQSGLTVGKTLACDATAKAAGFYCYVMRCFVRVGWDRMVH